MCQVNPPIIRKKVKVRLFDLLWVLLLHLRDSNIQSFYFHYSNLRPQGCLSFLSPSFYVKVDILGNSGLV